MKTQISIFTFFLGLNMVNADAVLASRRDAKLPDAIGKHASISQKFRESVLPNQNPSYSPPSVYSPLPPPIYPVPSSNLRIMSPVIPPSLQVEYENNGTIYGGTISQRAVSGYVSSNEGGLGSSVGTKGVNILFFKPF